jgi:hypothetical protein
MTAPASVKPGSFPLVFGIALGSCAVLLALLGFHYRHMNARFATESVPANAVVLVKKLEENTNADPRYLLQLGYSDRRQSSVQGWEAVPRPLWDSLKEGQTVAIVYLQTDPAIVRLVSPGITEEDGHIQLTFAAILGFGALCLLGVRWWKYRPS